MQKEKYVKFSIIVGNECVSAFLYEVAEVEINLREL